MKNKKQILSMKSRNALVGYAFFSLWIVGFLIFTLYPIIHSLIISFNSVTIATDGMKYEWAGFNFYDYALNKDLYFKPKLGSALLMICCTTPIAMVFATIISMLLNQNYTGRTFFRVLFFFPVIIMSGPVINQLLNKYTIDFSANNPMIFEFVSIMPEFIAKPCTYILNNFVQILWFSGVQMLIILAGLKNISPSLYEAADIDGAGAWEKFWTITLPHLVPLLLICAIYTVVDVANYTNNDVNVYISRHMFDINGLYSFSAAMSWIYFAIVMVVLLVVYLIFALVGRKTNK